MVTPVLKANVLVRVALELPESGGPVYKSPRCRIGGPGYSDSKDVSGSLG